MNNKVGIWIDHKKAVIVSASGDRVTAKTLESDVGPHTRYSGPEDGGGEKKYEERHGQHLDRYYDEIISQLSHIREWGGKFIIPIPEVEVCA